MTERRRRRRRRKGGGERAHIHSIDGFPLFPDTHSLSQTHPLLRGRQEREGAGGEEREENNWGEGGQGEGGYRVMCCIQGPVEKIVYRNREYFLTQLQQINVPLLAFSGGFKHITWSS